MSKRAKKVSSQAVAEVPADDVRMGSTVDENVALTSSNLREALAERGVGQAITAAGKRIETIDNRSRDELYRELGGLYGIAQVLARDPDLWMEFCFDPGWDELSPAPAPNDCRKALRHVLRFAFSATGISAQKQVSKYSLALQSPFQEGVAASEIPQMVRDAGGIEAMARQSSAKRSAEENDPSAFALRLQLGERTKELMTYEIGDQVLLTLTITEKTASGALGELLNVKRVT
jgi:hypothetical protein